MEQSNGTRWLLLRQIDCLQYRLLTSLLPTVRLRTKIIAYSSIAYVHFCAQIKILETELLLPTLSLPTARLPTYFIAYSSQPSTRNEGHLTLKNGLLKTNYCVQTNC